MSIWDRVDLGTLGKCCVTTVQRRSGPLPTTGERLPCGTHKIEFTNGRWRLAQDSVRASQNSGNGILK